MPEQLPPILQLMRNFIRHSGGGVPELPFDASERVTHFIRHSGGGVPEQGNGRTHNRTHFIRHSGGGVPEHVLQHARN